MKYITKLNLQENNIRGTAIIATLLIITLDIITINNHLNSLFSLKLNTTDSENQIPLHTSQPIENEIIMENMPYEKQENSVDFIVEDMQSLGSYMDNGIPDDKKEELSDIL